MHHDKALSSKTSDENPGFKDFYTYPPTAEGQALCNDADAKYLHHSLVWQRFFGTFKINRNQAMADGSFPRFGHFIVLTLSSLLTLQEHC